MIRISHAALAALMVLLTACNLPQATPAPTVAGATAIPATSAPAVSAPTTAPVPVQAAQHIIGIRQVSGSAEFYDTRSGARFVPRGNNYVRLGPQTKADGSPTFGHSLFDPGKYDPARVRADLEKMHNDGYNVVRVFISPDTSGTPAGGLSSAYMDNVADLLAHARDSQVFVMFTQDWIPGGKYGEILNRECCTTFTAMNVNYISAAGMQANQAFFHDFAADLVARRAPTEYIWSYQLRNEMFYDSDQPPLAFSSGTVTAANGQTYDMANAADKQRMMEENNIHWLNSVRASVLEADPTALVSVGIFVPHGPNPARIGDARVVMGVPILRQTQIDFIDVHAYPGYELNLLQHVQNFGMQGVTEKPIVMGEFGGEVSRFASVEAAAYSFIDWQVESCSYGFDGWLFWTWDTNEQPDFFNALMNEGAINGALAPVLRPDPCVR